MNVEHRTSNIEHRMISERRLLIFVLLAAVWFLIPPDSAADSEYTMKGAFLERISRFVKWPAPSGMNDRGKPFVIAVIGKNPFGLILEQLYAKRKIKNKEVKIRYIEGAEEITGCHMLFISKSVKNTLDQIISVTRNKPILTLGDTKGFAEKKVLVNLYADSKQYPFVINVTAFRESGLKIDYHLLDMAKIIK